MKISKVFMSLAFVAVLSFQVSAQDFVIGDAGFVIPGNNWPDGENPSFVVDGAGQKYLNFGQTNTGFAVTPDVGASVATSMTLWAANDAVERDPSSYEIWGTNETLPEDAGPGTALPLSAFTPISVGDLMLPETRNDGGDADLLDENSYTVSFDNSAEYTSYLIVFPTIKGPNANSMQIADVQLFDADMDEIFEPGIPVIGGQVVPEPSAGLLGALSVLGLLFVRNRRK